MGEDPTRASHRFASRRLADALGFGAVGFGLAVFGAGVALFAVWELALGRIAVARLPGDPETVLSDGRVAINHILCTAYLVAAFVHALRAGDRTLARLRPALADGPETEAALDASGDGRTVRLFGAMGLAASFVVASVSPGDVSYDPRSWTAEVTWHRVLSFALGFLSFRLSALLLLQSLRLSRLAARVREIDLLDLASLAPFTAQGLTNALLILGFAATYALFLVEIAYLRILTLLLVFTGAVAAAGLLLPLQGVRRRIQQAKRVELAWCRERIRAVRRALEGASRAEPGAGRLDELVAWEARVEAVREWPLDASAIGRFALYLLIPLASWSGAALVERGIDELLE